MVGESWAERQRKLAAAGLLVLGKEAQAKIENLSEISPLIEAAQRSNVTLLNEQTVDQMLSLVPKQPDSEKTSSSPPQQTTLADPESGSVIGRVIAPVSNSTLSPPIRRHGLEHYSLDDFPMLARDVDSQIEVHFDITGNSTTEGKMGDMQSCFSDRLRQIRQMMMTSHCLPRRPISNTEAWRNRQRHSSNEYEITLVGLVCETRWARGSGNLNFILEDETMQIRCSLRTPSGASPLHPAID